MLDVGDDQQCDQGEKKNSNACTLALYEVVEANEHVEHAQVGQTNYQVVELVAVLGEEVGDADLVSVHSE